jgi:hypothetical protein
LGRVFGLLGVTQEEAGESVGVVELAPGETQEALLMVLVGSPRSPSHVRDVRLVVKCCSASIQTNDRR